MLAYLHVEWLMPGVVGRAFAEPENDLTAYLLKPLFLIDGFRRQYVI